MRAKHLELTYNIKKLHFFFTYQARPSFTENVAGTFHHRVLLFYLYLLISDKIFAYKVKLHYLIF